MKITCEHRYREAIEHAGQTGDKSLQECLERFKNWEEENGWEVTFYYDSSPLSFYFEIKNKDGNRVFNGGLLYHGNPDKSFAVQIEPSIGWKIHT